MKNAKRAIGYVCDIPIQKTDEVIKKEDQRARILKYAEKENLEVICIYEDEEFTEDFARRPGIKKVLECAEDFDTVLVERVWCLTRKMKDMKPFLEKLDAKDVQIVSTSYLWDCVSQDVRHRYSKKLTEKSKQAAHDKATTKKTGQQAA